MKPSRRYPGHSHPPHIKSLGGRTRPLNLSRANTRGEEPIYLVLALLLAFATATADGELSVGSHLALPARRTRVYYCVCKPERRAVADAAPIMTQVVLIMPATLLRASTTRAPESGCIHTTYDTSTSTSLNRRDGNSSVFSPPSAFCRRRCAPAFEDKVPSITANAVTTRPIPPQSCVYVPQIGLALGYPASEKGKVSPVSGSC